MEILKVENLSFTYPGLSMRAIDGISFTIERGDFVTVCGATGSGKSTLLRLLKRELIPLGDLSGRIIFDRRPADTLSARESASRIGYVMQRPEMQIVTDRVWHELAFGLENLCFPQDVIRRRVSETASYFGIEDWFRMKVSDLSGGQKQILNLAAVMVMQPDLLILDEPTSQLDPIAASTFITTLSKLNRELSLTIILSEHRLEEVIPISNKLLSLTDGKLDVYGDTRSAVTKLCNDSTMPEDLPVSTRLFSRFGISGTCPLDVREGRNFIISHFGNKVRSIEEHSSDSLPDKALEFKDIYFRYSRDTDDILSGLTFTVYCGQSLCILGGNGSGKSTALAVAASLLSPYSGSVRVFGKKIKDYSNLSLYKNCLAMLPQDVQTVFLRNTVREELEDVCCDTSALPFSLDGLYDRHPYDLSGGQQQLVALAKVLASHPRLLLLDEPTKGLDARTKNELTKYLNNLKSDGMTIVCVTHDLEFAASFADRCALLFQGEITSLGTPRSFFSGNAFYTTASNRMTRGYYDDVVTVDDVERLCRANAELGSVVNASD